MPTTRPRYPITETDEIAIVLDQAEHQWGDLPRAELIRLILHDWADGGRSARSRRSARESLIASMPGSASVYDRAEDWPE